MSEAQLTPAIEKPKLDDLIPRAKEAIAALKLKHKGNNNAKALEDAGTHAYNVWLKAAKENTLTGAAQLDDRSGVSSIERYFLSRMPKK